MVAFLIIVILAIILIVRNIRIVPERHVFVLERLGSYIGTWEHGVHVKMPFVDRIVKDLSLKEQVLDFKPQPVITKDNVTMQIDSVVYAKIFDPKLYTYGVENPMSGLENLTATTLRSVIGSMELDQTLSSREDINDKMRSVLDEATDAWGIKVTRVEIKNIQPPREIEEVMTKQMRAERERRQTLLEANAHQEAVVTRAKGDKDAKVLAAEAEKEAEIKLAEGKAESVRILTESEAAAAQKLKDGNLQDIVIALRKLETLKDVSDGQATKIYLPSDLQDAASIGEMIGGAVQKTSVQKSLPRDQYRHLKADAAAAHAASEDACLSPQSSKGTKEAAVAGYKQSKTLNS